MVVMVEERGKRDSFVEQIKNDFGYEFIGPFRGGIARAMKDGQWFHIRKDGSPIYQERYQEVDDFLNGFAVVCKDGLWSHIKADGSLAHDQWFLWAFNFMVYQDLESEGPLALVKLKEPNDARTKTESFKIRPDGSRYYPQAPKAQ